MVDVDADGAEGVIASQGSGLGGWVLYCAGEAVRWHLNVSSKRRTTVSGPARLPAGRHEIEMRFVKTAELHGEVRLLLDGNEIGAGSVDYNHVTRVSMTGAGLSVGCADAYPVCDDPAAGTAFTGSIQSVTIALDGDPHIDPGEAETAIAAQ